MQAWTRTFEISFDRATDIVINVVIGVVGAILLAALGSIVTMMAGQDVTDAVGALLGLATLVVFICAIMAMIESCINGTDRDRDEVGRCLTDAYITYHILDSLFGDDD